jgi:hypothetical protein
MARQMACANDELIGTPYAVVIWWSRGDANFTMKMNRSLFSFATRAEREAFVSGANAALDVLDDQDFRARRVPEQFPAIKDGEKKQLCGRKPTVSKLWGSLLCLASVLLCWRTLTWMGALN